VTVAPNQEPAALELSRRGLIVLVGDARDVSADVIAAALSRLIETGLAADWSERCLEAVDGRGADRVAAVITASPATRLKARLADANDEALLLEWANDPATRQNAFSSAQISPPTHAAWFRDKLRDHDSCRLYLVETEDEVPLGMVRLERGDGRWEIHYSIAQAFRRRGLARPMLQAVLLDFETENRGAKLFGQVKETYHASRRVFESLGWNAADHAREGVLIFERCVPDRVAPRARAESKH
jgi:RimJ/RimL family protein N-acetyltransferase